MESTPGARLRYLRELLGYKGQQQDFADKVGLTQQSVSNMERDKTEPAAKSLNKIYAAFPQVNLGWLVSGAGQPLDTMARDGKALAPLPPTDPWSPPPAAALRRNRDDETGNYWEAVAAERLNLIQTLERTVERLWGQNTDLLKKPEASADAADLYAAVDEIADEYRYAAGATVLPAIPRFVPRPLMRHEVGGFRLQA